jgi:hypothetical protein
MCKFIDDSDYFYFFVQLDVLLGDELELKRQLQEIEYLEDFLQYQQHGDATQFLFSWSRHQQYRAELHDFKFFRNEIDVELDLKVTGNISVGEDDNTPNAMMATQQQVAKKVTKPVGGGAVTHNSGNAGMVGMGLPRKLQERRVQRRTSVSFSLIFSFSTKVTAIKQYVFIGLFCRESCFHTVYELGKPRW